jgi:cytochrome c-type biogenesis protein CcmH/NrfG
MDNRLGDYYFSVGENHEALLAYTDGDRLYPNNLASLLGMKRSLVALEKNEEAEQLQKRIDKLAADH